MAATADPHAARQTSMAAPADAHAACKTSVLPVLGVAAEPGGKLVRGLGQGGPQKNRIPEPR